MQLLKLGIDVLVDVVVLRKRLPCEPRLRIQNRDGDRGEPALIANKKRGFADAFTGDFRRSVNLCYIGRVRLDCCLFRDIACLAVPETSRRP